VLVQLVEIPGLIQGAAEGRGGGRALLGVLRGADAMVICHDASKSLDDLQSFRAELERAQIELPAVVAVTKTDEGPPDAVAELERVLPDFRVIGVSVLDDASLDAFRESVLQLTGLIRVYLRQDGVDPDPVALHPPVTVADVAGTIHHDLERECSGARVWGPSARFDGQRVGRAHELRDGDAVEILVR
jgi:ribosome-interacting GTPase 1